MSDAPTTDSTLFEDFFYTLGANHEVISSVMPRSIEEAIHLGSTIQEQPWFDPNQIQLGGIFQITSVMLEMRDNDDPHWPLVCAVTQHMPPHYKYAGNHSSDDPDSASSVYANIKLNVDVVRNREEDHSPAGREKGHRILFKEPRV